MFRHPALLPSGSPQRPPQRPPRALPVSRRRAPIAIAPALLLAAAACTHVRVAGAPVAVASTVTVDTVLAASIRPLTEGDDTSFADSLAFAVVTRARDDGGLRRELTVTPIDASTFRALLARSAEPVIVGVHGVGSGRANAWGRALDARRRAEHAGPWVIFQWPARGSHLEAGGDTWALPMLTAYRNDRERALASASALAELLAVVTDAVPPDRVAVLAHSAGALVLGEALAGEPALAARLTRSPLRAVAFFAADVDPVRFSRHYLPAAQHLALRVVRYAARDDRLLQLARRVHGRERLGLLRDDTDAATDVLDVPDLWLGRIETIDITDAPTDEPALISAFLMHHSEQRERAALRDFVHIVVAGRPATCRADLGVAAVTGTREREHWRLLPTSPASYLRACTTSPNPGR